MRHNLKIKGFKAFAIATTAGVALASCAVAQTPSSPEGQAATSAEGAIAFATRSLGTFDQPWSLALEPGTNRVFLTERPGKVKWFDTSTGATGTVTGAIPAVDFGGQGGLGEIAFAPDYQTSRSVYLSFAEAGQNNTRGAALGRGKLQCDQASNCALSDFTVIWRQSEKVDTRGHYSHRIAFSPDGKYLFLTSGDRQKGDPAQDMNSNLGKVLRLNLDGTPAAGNPFEARGGVAREIWTLGNRSILGIAFDLEGRLWELEHGPLGGDELNLLTPGTNYGWPTVSNGDNYDGKPIPDHNTRPEFTLPAISWTPVIAPGNMIVYSGSMWPQWRGNALISSLKEPGIVRVTLGADGKAAESARYKLDKRTRAVIQGKDGSLLVLEDGTNARLLHLTKG